MEKQYIKALIEKATQNGDTFTFLASTAAIDRQGDSIDQSGWDVADYMKNPVMLWAHDYTAPPIAKAVSLNLSDPRGLVGTCEFAPTEFAQQIKTLVEGGFVSALSVGFMPEERNGNVITKSQLLEISFVPVPANQEALMLACKSLESKGFATDVVKSFMERVVEKADEDDEEVEQTETTEEEHKGAVSDEIAAEEMEEQKWGNLDPLFDIMGAFMDVYLNEETPVEAFSQLLLEVASLITGLANSPEDEDNQVQMSSFVELMNKTISPEMHDAFIAKVGATYSQQTTKQMQEVKDHVDSASAVLGGMLKASSTEGGDGSNDDTESDEGGDEKGVDAVRALLVVRGLLRERATSDTVALSVINQHFAGKV